MFRPLWDVLNTHEAELMLISYWMKEMITVSTD